MSRGERKAVIRRDQPDLSLNRQCRLLSISRSSFYYTPKGESVMVAPRRSSGGIRRPTTPEFMASKPCLKSADLAYAIACDRDLL